MARLSPPSEINIGLPLKKVIGCISKEPIKVGAHLVKVRNNSDFLCYHDLYHLEVSCLERIQMGKYKVSGIHGINSPMFHKLPILEEYDSLLDEARVALHEWLTRTSIFNTFKLICWMFWLITQGINPISVLIRHIKSLQSHNIFMTLIEDLNFVYLEQEMPQQ